MFRTCLPAGRYKENKKILLIPGPDLAWQDAVMETEAFIKQLKQLHIHVPPHPWPRPGILC